MKKIYFLMLSTFFLNHLIAQEKIPIIAKNEVQTIFDNIADESITRANSLSIKIEEFIFKVPKRDNFIPHLKILFHNKTPGQTSNLIKEYRYLFDNTISKVNKNGRYSTIGVKNIVFNQDLENVTHIELNVELVRIKKSSDDLNNLITSFIDVPVTNVPAINLIDKFINYSIDDDDTAPLLFSTEIEIPSNFFGYSDLKKVNKTPFISDKKSLGIIIDGYTDIKDNSIEDVFKNTFNSISKFISGKSIVSKPSVQIDGLIKLTFEKNKTSVLPNIVKRKLQKIKDNLDSFDPAEVPNNDNIINEYIKREFTSLEDEFNLLKEAGAITEIQKNHLRLYIHLCKVYYRHYVYDKKVKGTSDITKAYFYKQYKNFKSWSKRTSNYTQKNYVKGIYNKELPFFTEKVNDENVSTLFLLDSLDDDITQAIMDWQIVLDVYISERIK